MQGPLCEHVKFSLNHCFHAFCLSASPLSDAESVHTFWMLPFM